MKLKEIEISLRDNVVTLATEKFTYAFLSRVAGPAIGNRNTSRRVRIPEWHWPEAVEFSG